MNKIWYKIYGAFLDDDEVPFEVWRSRTDAIKFSKVENIIYREHRVKIKPIAIDVNK